MPELQYSAQALNVLSLFYGVRYVVFVEGDDDVPFWGSLFAKAGETDLEIAPVGGAKELDNRISTIVEEDARIVVGRDCDYSPFTSSRSSHPRVLYTYGYAMENTMYCPCAVNRATKKACRDRRDRLALIEAFFNEFCRRSEDLLVFDLANARFGKGVKVIGNNCCRFLTGRRSTVLSLTKISAHLQAIMSKFTDNELSESRQLCRKDRRTLRHKIKGHFLTHAVLNFVRRELRQARRKDTFPLEALYQSLVDACAVCAQDCSEWDATKEAIDQAVRSLYP